MPACRNDTSRSYRGTEQSPLGVGWSSGADYVGKVRKGLDGERWVVTANSSGAKSWRRVLSVKKSGGGFLPPVSGRPQLAPIVVGSRATLHPQLPSRVQMSRTLGRILTPGPKPEDRLTVPVSRSQTDDRLQTLRPATAGRCLSFEAAVQAADRQLAAAADVGECAGIVATAVAAAGLKVFVGAGLVSEADMETAINYLTRKHGMYKTVDVRDDWRTMFVKTAHEIAVQCAGVDATVADVVKQRVL